MEHKNNDTDRCNDGGNLYNGTALHSAAGKSGADFTWNPCNLFCNLCAGNEKGTASCCIYLLTGFIGIPVFTAFTSGPAKLLGPTGGYLLGYIFMALICGFVVDRTNNVFLCFWECFLEQLYCIYSERFGWHVRGI